MAPFAATDNPLQTPAVLGANRSLLFAGDFELFFPAGIGQ
jgi:hypothetical protein